MGVVGKRKYLLLARRRRINDITKRKISVVRALTSLPEPERARFWHEQVLPLAAEERVLREQLRVVGEGRHSHERLPPTSALLSIFPQPGVGEYPP